MGILYTHSGNNLDLELSEPEPGLLKIDISGRASNSEVDTIISIIQNTLTKYQEAQLLIDVQGFYSFPITKRTTIYTFIDELFSKNHVSYVMIINPNHFIRMMGFLTKSIYKNIRYAYYNTEEEALEFFKQSKDNITAQVSAGDLEFVLENNKSSEFIELISSEDWSSEEGSGKIKHYFLAPDILYLKMSGQMTSDVVDKMQNTIRSFGSTEKKINLVTDLSGCKSISKDARKNFEANSEEIDDRVKSKLFKFPSFVSALYKIYTYINPSYDRNTTLIKSTENALLNLLQKRDIESKISYKLPEFGEIEKEQFDSFEKQELINYLESYHEENRAKWLSVRENIDQIFEVVSKIAWKEDFNIRELQVPGANDPFHDLFHAVNILQHDVGEIVQQLRESNENLEQKIEERTRQIGEKESNLRSLLENYNSPICLLDKDFNLIVNNDVFHRLLEKFYGLDLNPNDNLFENAAEELVSRWRPKFEESLLGEFVNSTEEFIVEGESFYFDVRIFPILNEGEIIGVGVVGNDVTELNKSAKKLEDQNVSLLKLNNELDSFIYRSSHDLRAPVSSLLGLINIAKIEDSVEEKDKCLDLMEVSVNKMEAFIREIIDHTKNTKLDLEPSEIDLKKLVNGLIDELKHLDHNNSIRFDIEVFETPFISDEFRIKTILTNIISNCIKYYDPSKESYVSLNANRKNGEAIIEIKDNGQGIKSEYMSNLYDMFFRANDSSNGTGLGLYIVKDVLEKLDGKIEIQSNYGEGTEVLIRIPELTIH